MKKKWYAKIAIPFFGKKDANKVVKHSLYDEDLLESFRDEYYGFRRLRGSVYLQDVMPIDKIYMARVARALFYTSPVAKKVIMTPIIWYFSGGLNIVSKNKRIVKIAKEFVDIYERIIHDMLVAFMLDGELVVPILVMKNKLIEYGYVDGLSISQVNFDKKNAIFPDEIIHTIDRRDTMPEATSPVPSSDVHTLKVLRNNLITEEIYNGTDYCFYFRANNLPSYRGRSFIEQLIDVIYNFDSYISDIIVQNQLMGSVLWDITMNGASKDEIDNRRNELMRNPPPPGSFIVHNENETWTLVEKKYHGEAQRIDSDILLRHIALGSFLDLNWLGVQTREETYFQTTKFFEYIFHTYNCIIETLFRNYLLAYKFAGLLPKSLDERDFEISNSSHNVLLFKQTAITFVQLSNGLKVATDNGWISEETAKKILHEALNIYTDNLEVSKTISTRDLMAIINTLVAAYNTGVVNEDMLKETIQYYIDKSEFEIKGGQFVNPSNVAPAKSTGVQGEKVDV